jgi:hypothetical protein
MTKPWTGYVEDIVNDFHQMGMPITFEETPNGEYSVVGKGKIERFFCNLVEKDAFQQTFQL